MRRLSRLHAQLSPASAGPAKVEVERLDQVAIIYLNSPSDLNALTAQLKEEFCAALSVLDKDNAVKVIIVLSKVEKAFCAGANIKEMKMITFEDQMTADIFQQLHNTLDASRKPIIMGVHGLALGGGFELALLGDIIILSEDARLALPELRLGLIPGIAGTQRLARLAGRTRASRYIFTSDSISAEEARRAQVANLVVPREQLRSECLKLAQNLAQKSLYALIVGKQAVKQADETALSVGSRVERYLFNGVLSSENAKEGLRAFLEKRKAEFRVK